MFKYKVCICLLIMSLNSKSNFLNIGPTSTSANDNSASFEAIKERISQSQKIVVHRYGKGEHTRTKRPESNFIKDTANAILSYKYIVLASATASYSYIYYKIKSAQARILAPDNIANWKSNLSWREIMNMSDNVLKVDFMNDMNAKYGEEIAFLYNKELFIEQKLDEEIRHAQFYLDLCALLNTIYLDFIFPIDKKCLSIVKDHLNKLAVIKRFLKNQTTPLDRFRVVRDGEDFPFVRHN